MAWLQNQLALMEDCIRKMIGLKEPAPAQPEGKKSDLDSLGLLRYCCCFVEEACRIWFLGCSSYASVSWRFMTMDSGAIVS